MDVNQPVIVVGLDADPGAAAALRWAIEEAYLRGARIHAVYAYSEPVVADINLVPPDHAHHVAQAERAAESWRDAAVADSPAYRGVDVSVTVEIGPPGPVLIEAAADAVLLVVGSREHHPLYRLVHGSVSHFCISHAPCPVVAVPALP